jgi:hypothetical protein
MVSNDYVGIALIALGVCFFVAFVVYTIRVGKFMRDREE